MVTLVHFIFERWNSILVLLGGIAYLLGDILKSLVANKMEWRLLSEQIYQTGIRSLSLVLVTAICSGMVMALQFGLGLEKFGGKLYVPKIVSLSFVRELGPVFTSLVIAGRVGAGFASEIGSMVVTQQIDAIRALGTSPIQKIVIPRVLSLMITLPILTAIAMITGIWGSMLIGSWELNLDANFYAARAIQILVVGDFMMGCMKTVLFAVVVAVPACYYGLRVKNGTKGVGIATTKAVVTGSIFIFFVNVVVTKIFWMVMK